MRFYTVITLKMEASKVSMAAKWLAGAVELDGQGGHLPTQFLENKIENL